MITHWRVKLFQIEKDIGVWELIVKRVFAGVPGEGGTWHYVQIPWTSYLHAFWLGYCHAYGWGFSRKMAVEGVVLRKRAVEKGKFARSVTNFQKLVYFGANLGSFMGLRKILQSRWVGSTFIRTFHGIRWLAIYPPGVGVIKYVKRTMHVLCRCFSPKTAHFLPNLGP